MSTLPNGVRVISETVAQVRSVSLGIWVVAGSRHETPSEAGLCHFIEHMVFKGTATRSARDIAEAIDSVGGLMDAFTDKEYTCFYVRLLSEHLPLALDVLSDMILNPSFDPQELEREKNVILEEIKRHEDSPEDRVHDLFAATLWPNHPLGAPVIGTWDTVSSFNADTLREFMGRWYGADQILVAAAGDVEHENLVAQVASHLGGRATGTGQWTQHETQSVPGRAGLPRETEQVHLCYGGPGLPHRAEERYALAVLDTAFGGGMSSRVFQEIRENRGLAYAIGSYYVSYHEGGAYAVYAGTSPDSFQQVLSLVDQEANRLCQEGLRPEELERTKQQIKGALLLGLESMSDRMTRLAKTELNLGRVLGVDEVLENLEHVTGEDVVAIAQRVLNPAQMALATIGPTPSG
ncbi:MAG TPA: pitrilysin family protein [Armatimonadota bacterium]